MHFQVCVARRSARWGSVFSALLLLGPNVAEAVAPYKGALRVEPRAIAYRHQDDTFAHQESSLAALRKERIGGDRAYHGNRMTQYKFIGPAGQGGIYDALHNYKARRPLDAKNYQYRW